MWFSESKKVEFIRNENFQLGIGTAAIVGGMLTGMMMWAAGMTQIGGPWPDWATPFTIITVGLISYTALAAKLFGSAVSRKAIEDNTAMLKKIDAGQAEIIRLLKAGAPAGAAAAGVQPSAAASANGRGGDNDLDGRTGHPASFNPEGAPEWKK